MELIDISKPWPGWVCTRVLGRGSFGAVYEIERDVFGSREHAALKHISIPQSPSDLEELFSEGYDQASITERFQGYLKDIVKEYSLMAAMKGHPNVVYCDDVRYVQQDNGIGWDIFIKMELLTPLVKYLGPEPDELQVIRLGKDLCKALTYCEENNIVHRDIKPQNVFAAPDGTFKLGDFGVAKTVEKTAGGTKIGTYKYMAPEVYNNQPYGFKADQYSLGLVLYWAANRRRAPFLPPPPALPRSSEEEAARARRFRGEPLPPPANAGAELSRIILKACAYDPEQRFASAGEMYAALEALETRLFFERERDDDTTMDEDLHRKIRRREEERRRQDERSGQQNRNHASGPDGEADRNNDPLRQERGGGVERNGRFGGEQDAGDRKKKSETVRRSPLPKILLAALLVILLGGGAALFFLLGGHGTGDPAGRVMPSPAVLTEAPAETAEPADAQAPAVAEEPSALEETAEAAAPEESPEPEERWVVLRETRYEDGAVANEIENTYENGLLTERLRHSVYSYNNTEEHIRSLYRYNSEGLLERIDYYDVETGDLTGWDTRSYDGEKRILSIWSYDYSGVLTKETRYSYTDDRIVVEDLHYDDAGQIQSRFSRELDAEQNILSSSDAFYFSSGNTSNVTEYYYDKDGNAIGSHTESDDPFSGHTTSDTVYIYDEEGLLIRSETSGRYSSSTVYYYDADGNEVLNVFTYEGEESSRTETEWGLMRDGEIVRRSGEVVERTAPLLPPAYVPGAGSETADAAPADLPVQAGSRIALSRSRILAVKSDGTVLFAGLGSAASDAGLFGSWKDVVAVDMAFNGNLGYYVGLKSDGTPLSSGFALYNAAAIEDWTDLAAIYPCFDNCYGLKTDGSVVASGSESYGALGVSHLTDAAMLCRPENSRISEAILVVNGDGTLDLIGERPAWMEGIDLSRYRNVRSVSLTSGHFLVLKNDGTVAPGEEADAYPGDDASYERLTGQSAANRPRRSACCEVESWTDIVKITAASGFSAGLRSDGTVLVAADSYREDEVAGAENWTGVTDLLVGSDYLLALKSDGTVVATKDLNLDGFTDVQELYLSPHGDLIVGLRTDGSVITNSEDFNTLVADWKLF